MARMSAKAQARYDELKRISAKGGSTLMSNSTFEYVAESATEGQFAFFMFITYLKLYKSQTEVSNATLQIFQ